MEQPSLEAIIRAREKYLPLLARGKETNLELRWGKEHHVSIHKELLFLQCPVFKSILDWRKRNGRDTSNLYFYGEHPLIMKALITYLYEGTYDPPTRREIDSPLLFHVDLADAAELWGLKRLKCVADEFFMKILLESFRQREVIGTMHMAYLGARATNAISEAYGR
ncbi:uncharacterized protein IWZ02DRAFT_494151 [Phyllosticta citriasiana]|uniref:uncharacterized protein n=1 Tax=Phyllosticta citriasiana TaxID=595635 RepID=UPI0030FD7CF9